MRYGHYANGFRFDSHLADFRFIFLLHFFSGLGVTFRPLGVSVRLGLQLRLGLRLGFGFIFYVKFVSTKPTTLSSCIIVTSQVAY